MSEHNSKAMPNTGIDEGIMKTLDKGVIQSINAKYVFTGKEVANDMINIAVLPAGAKFLPYLSYINGNEATAKATIEGYVGATSMGSKTNLAATATAIDFEEAKRDTVLKAKLDVAPAAGKEVNFLIVYRLL